MRIFERIHSKLNWSRERYIGVVFGLLALGYLSSAIYHVYKPLPQGLDFTGKLRHADVQFIADQSYLDSAGRQHLDQHIFKQMLSLIDQAQTTIVLDMFLFNPETGSSQAQHQALMQQLTDALIHKRQSAPNVEIIFITDPINSVYGGIYPEQYHALRQAGVDLIETDLSPLRASNPLWSSLWYFCCQGAGNNPDKGWLPNPFGHEKITLRSYFNLFNFKANHRKTLTVDTAEGWKSLVGSMNPHDGSSRHSNAALLVQGRTALDVMQTEQAVGLMSKANMPAVIAGDFEDAQSLPQVQVLTEGAIYRAVLEMINSAKPKENIDLAMFYLSERGIVKALGAAQARGVNVRVLLDPNKDAFGRQKNGIPNRPVAAELHKAGVNVRWCNTQGEQCHSKMILKTGGAQSELILGSANFTARNLKNYNLETDLNVIGAPQAPVFTQAAEYFNGAWSNLNGRQISVEYGKYADESKLKYALYRFMEWSGLSAF